MRPCETCIHHDQENTIPVRYWMNNRYLTSSIKEYHCKLHNDFHLKSDTCPNHVRQEPSMESAKE